LLSETFSEIFEVLAIGMNKQIKVILIFQVYIKERRENKTEFRSDWRNNIPVETKTTIEGPVPKNQRIY
jgi:hypothetical protein